MTWVSIILHMLQNVHEHPAHFYMNNLHFHVIWNTLIYFEMLISGGNAVISVCFTEP